MCQPSCGGRNVGKGLSDGMECTGGEQRDFHGTVDGAVTEMDTDFMLKTLDYIKVFENGTLLVVFLVGTEIECKNEEE